MMSSMRILVAVIALLITAPAGATTLKDFNAKPDKEQSACVANFIDKMTTDLREKNPVLATDIRNWFAVKADGKPLSEGMEKLAIELATVEIQARDGRADLSKIQVESVIMYVVRQKFAAARSAPK
jgi:hypothetical protein